MNKVPKAGEYVYCIKSYNEHIIVDKIYKVVTSTFHTIWIEGNGGVIYGFAINFIMEDYEKYFCSLRHKKLENLNNIGNIL